MYDACAVVNPAFLLLLVVLLLLLMMMIMISFMVLLLFVLLFAVSVDTHDVVTAPVSVAVYFFTFICAVDFC